jgi:hypothetical protein
VSVLCLDSREVVRVSARVMQELRKKGGRSTKPLIKNELPGDERWLPHVFKHLEEQGKITVVGWRVSLGRAA